jgi:hypothetical protein
MDAGAAAVDSAQKFADSQFAQKGMFAIPYLGKLIGKDNAEYIRQIRVYDKNLYQDLLKKLSKQIDYMEEQLKLYQQI